MTADSEPLRRIFIVDEHPVFRMGLRSAVCAEARFTVCGETGDAVSALEQLRSVSADVVLIGCDTDTPEARTLIKFLKSQVPAPRVLILAAREEDSDVERALRAGADGYVQKDARPEQITEALGRILRGGLALPPQSAETLLRRMTSGSPATPIADEQRLTERERAVFELMGQGVSTRGCSEQLKLSIKTIEAHQSSIKRKLSIKDGNQLRRRAVLWVSERRGPSR